MKRAVFFALLAGSCWASSIFSGQQQSVAAAPVAMDTSGEAWGKQAKATAAQAHEQADERTSAKRSESDGKMRGFFEAFAIIKLARLGDRVASAAAISSGGKTLVIGSTLGDVTEFDFETGEFVCHAVFETPVTAVEVSKTHIAAASHKNFEIIAKNESTCFKLSAENPIIQVLPLAPEESFMVVNEKGRCVRCIFMPRTKMYIDHPWELVHKKLEGPVIVNRQAAVALSRAEREIKLGLLKNQDHLYRAIGAPQTCETGSSRTIDAVGISPDGTVVVTALGTQATVWYACGAPRNFSFPEVPDTIKIDATNQRILYYRKEGSRVFVYDIQNQQKPTEVCLNHEGILLDAFFFPPEPSSILLLSKQPRSPKCNGTESLQSNSGGWNSVVTLHAIKPIELSAEQAALLMLIHYEKEQKGKAYTGHCLSAEQKHLLSTVSPWVKRVLKFTYKVQL